MCVNTTELIYICDQIVLRRQKKVGLRLFVEQASVTAEWITAVANDDANTQCHLSATYMDRAHVFYEIKRLSITSFGYSVLGPCQS